VVIQISGLSSNIIMWRLCIEYIPNIVCSLGISAVLVLHKCYLTLIGLCHVLKMLCWNVQTGLTLDGLQAAII